MKYSRYSRNYLGSFILASSLVGMSGLTGCQEVNQPTTTLTQAQWQEVKANILSEADAPEPQYPVGAKFGDIIELIGFDISNPLVAGKPVTFTWYWKALKDIDDHWKVFVHFDSAGKKPFRQNLDHQPLNGLYQTGRWKKGQIIKDVQKVTINADYPQGQAVPYIGFYKGEQRLAIANGVKKTDDRRVIGPALMVSNTKQKEDAAALPTYLVPRLTEADLSSVRVDGKLDEEFWAKAQPVFLAPLGAAPDLKTEVRILRGPDHLLIGATLPDEHIWSTLDKRDADLWTEEVFEVYIDTNRDGKDYLELQINPLGTIFDAHFVEQLGRGEGTREEQIDRARSWNMEGLESAVVVDGSVNDPADKDRAWTVELKIPFKAIPGVDAPPEDGAQWAVNFYRFDRPDDKRTYAYAWSRPTSGNFHQFERFGNLKFGETAMRTLQPMRLKRMQQQQQRRSQNSLKLDREQVNRMMRMKPLRSNEAEPKQ